MRWFRKRKRWKNRNQPPPVPMPQPQASKPSRILALVKAITSGRRQAQPPVEADAGEILRQRIAELPQLAEEKSRVAANGVVMLSDERAELDRRLERGVATALPGVNAGVPLDAVLGIDFGTSSTKIVARLPYQPGAPSFAVPAVPFAAAERHPHMWESRLWMTSDGIFSLAPAPDAGVLSSIKTSLMAPDCERRLVMHAPGMSATALDCAIAFLALQIRQARGWLYERHAASFGRGPLRWHYNMGLPAAKLDQCGTALQYRTCLASAIELAGTPGPIALDAVRKTIAGIGSPAERLSRQNAALLPEIAAAVAGFARSRRREDGLYAMVDVGAGTMDCCTFSLRAGEEGDRCPIFAADVSLLGMQPFELCGDNEALKTSFAGEVNSHVCRVIRPTKTMKYPTSPRWKEGLPVFLVGGGKPSKIHRSEIINIDRNMRQAHWGGLKVLDLPEPEGLEHSANNGELHRLAVAVGLSLPATDIPEVELPTSIDDIPLLSWRDYEKGFVGKELV